MENYTGWQIYHQKWLKQMHQNVFWCDDVFFQITANVLILNIMIPLNPSSSHHAGMYSDIPALGEPIYMLYFEEWR